MLLNFRSIQISSKMNSLLICHLLFEMSPKIYIRRSSLRKVAQAQILLSMDGPHISEKSAVSNPENQNFKTVFYFNNYNAVYHRTRSSTSMQLLLTVLLDTKRWCFLNRNLISYCSVCICKYDLYIALCVTSHLFSCLLILFFTSIFIAVIKDEIQMNVLTFIQLK